MLAFFGLLAILSRLEARRRHRIATERKGESVCSFARAIDMRRLDPWIVRAVYEEVHDTAGFPLRPSDTLLRDLRLHEDDLDLIVMDIARRCGRSLDDFEQNPCAGPIETVRDLIEVLNAQPRTA